nr:MAG: major capsid protein [Gokushovirinae sp.]
MAAHGGKDRIKTGGLQISNFTLMSGIRHVLLPITILCRFSSIKIHSFLVLLNLPITKRLCLGGTPSIIRLRQFKSTVNSGRCSTSGRSRRRISRNGSAGISRRARINRSTRERRPTSTVSTKRNSHMYSFQIAPRINFLGARKWLMMVNQTGDAIQRHGSGALILNINISPKLIRILLRDSNNTINYIRILLNPVRTKSRKTTIIVTKMPHIKGLCCLGSHFSSASRRFVTIVCPSFLISENFIVFLIPLRINFLIQDSHFAKIGENRPVIVKTTLTAPKTLKALLISMVVSSNHNTNNKTMFNKRLLEVTVNVSSERLSGRSALRGCSSFGILQHLINGDRNTVATKILGPLKASIGRGNTKMRLQNLNIAGTTSSVSLIQLLNLESGTELIDSSGRSIARIESPQVRRGDIINASHIIIVRTRSCKLSIIKRLNRTRTVNSPHTSAASGIITSSIIPSRSRKCYNG